MDAKTGNSSTLRLSYMIPVHVPKSCSAIPQRYLLNSAHSSFICDRSLKLMTSYCTSFRTAVPESSTVNLLYSLLWRLAWPVPLYHLLSSHSTASAILALAPSAGHLHPHLHCLVVLLKLEHISPTPK